VLTYPARFAATVHNGEAKNVLKKRAEIKTASYKLRQERFLNGKPKIEKLPQKVVQCSKGEKSYNIY
jgi:hypothetical protein